MSKFKKGDKVRIRRFGAEGTVVKAGAKMAPQYSRDLANVEQLWLVKLEGPGYPRLLAESLLEAIEG